jgi:hypothetical protein
VVNDRARERSAVNRAGRNICKQLPCFLSFIIHFCLADSCRPLHYSRCRSCFLELNAYSRNMLIGTAAPTVSTEWRHGREIRNSGNNETIIHQNLKGIPTDSNVFVFDPILCMALNDLSFYRASWTHSRLWLVVSCVSPSRGNAIVRTSSWAPNLQVHNTNAVLTYVGNSNDMALENVNPVPKLQGSGKCKWTLAYVPLNHWKRALTASERRGTLPPPAQHDIGVLPTHVAQPNTCVLGVRGTITSFGYH